MLSREPAIHGRPVWAGLLFLTILGAAGCTSNPYRPGRAEQYYVAPEMQQATKTQIERGQPRPVLDTVGWVVGIPGKIVLWDRRVSNHDISPRTEEAMAEYLAANELTAVKVRLNEYAPGDEWQRLVANKSMAWGWRYSLGTVSWLGYTLLPGRVFGSDDYNPYTNTVSLYSDIPAVALHEGGHARYWAEREYKGNHAAVYSLVPGAPLYYEAMATDEVLSYLHDVGTADEEREGYVILYPAYSTYVGNSLGGTPAWSGLAFLAGGHVAGRVQANRVAERPVVTEPHPDACLSP